MTYLDDGLLARLRALGDEPDEPSMLGDEAAQERFVLEERVGAGGMGEVFRGRDRETGRVLAIKLLSAVAESDYQRFRREASAMAELEDSAIVRYVAHGRRHGRPFLAMEWLEGENLEERLAQGAITLAESVTIARRIASALAALHERGIVHRDIKPSNVFLRSGEAARATLIDLGIARRSLSEMTVTGPGVVIGTPGYMAPEQARGSEWIDARADVFALGCLLYRCATGRNPFRGRDPIALLTKTLFSEPPRPRQLVARIPAALDALIVRMLAKDPRGRPADGGEVLRELDAVQDVGDEVAPTSADHPLLTRAERRLTSVLLIGSSETAPASHHADWASWVSAARKHGVRLEPLAAGSIAALLTHDAAGDEIVLRIARAALALRTLVRDVPMVIVTGRAVRDAEHEVNEVVDRGALALGQVSQSSVRDKVRVDRLSARLLAPHFEIERARDGAWLVPARAERADVVPLVGRERELEELHASFLDSLQKKEARATLVTGPAGIGKSRLVRELLARIARSTPGTQIWVGRGDGARLGSPFALLGQAISRGLGLTPALDPDERRALLERRVGEVVPEAEHARVSTFVAELVGLRPPAEPGSPLDRARRDPALLGENMLRAFIDFVLAQARATGLCLALEDVHWADAPSLAFTERALNRARDLPLFVVGVARTPSMDTLDELWRGDFRSVYPLSGLSSSKSTELVRRWVGRELDAERLVAIVQRADGNPFVLEELAHAARAGRSEVPESALALVEGRLQRLPAETRRVLRAASIFGETFWLDAVQALVDDVSLESPIEELEREGLVARSGTSRLAPSAELVFRHALVREAAYATLTADDRLLGHRLAARWLEAAGEPDPWPIAEHHRLAGAPEAAAAHYLRAAELALAASAFDATLERVERAFECHRDAGRRALDDGQKAALWLMAAEARRWKGQLRPAIDAAEEALQRFERGSESWFHAISELASAAGRLGEYDRVARALDAAARVQVDPARRSAQLVALCPGTTQLLQSGRIGTAARLYAAIEKIAARARLDPVAEARVCQLRGFHRLHAGDPWEAMQCFERGSELFQQLGSARNAAVEWINFAHAALLVGELERAESALRGALAIGEQLGLGAVRAYANLNLGRLHLERGQIDEAEQAEARALSIGITEHSPRLIGAARVHLGAIALERGDPAVAEAEALAAVDLLEVAPPLQVGALAVLARALTAQGRAGEARAPSERALAMVEAGQHDTFDALVGVAHVEVLMAEGEREAAQRALESATRRLAARRPQRTRLQRRLLELARELGIST